MGKDVFIAESKVFFWPEADTDWGIGHVMRCLALADYLRPRFETSFILGSKSKEIENIISAAGQVVYSDSLDYTNAERLQYFLEKAGIKPFDIVVLDSYQFTQQVRDFLKSHLVKIVCIDDFQKAHRGASLIINMAPGLKKSDFENTEADIAMGLDYALLRPEFIEAAKEKRQTIETILDVFVCFGGTDIKNLSTRVCNALLSQTAYHIHLVIGPAFKNESDIKSLSSKFPNRLKLYRNSSAEEIKQLMQKCSFGVVPASGLLYEALACKLPVISGFYAENQQKMYNGFLAKAAIIPANSFSEAAITSALKAVDSSSLQLLTTQISNLVDGESPERIKSLFKNLCRVNMKLREAELSDCDLFFNWANDEDVRANAFNSGEIEWQAHNEWYHAKIKSPNAALFVLEVENIPLGQIRFDNSTQGWTIDFSVAKNFRGLGLGSYLLEIGVKRFREKRGNNTIIAEVKAANTSSLKAFEKAGALQKPNTSNSEIVTYEF